LRFGLGTHIPSNCASIGQWLPHNIIRPGSGRYKMTFRVKGKNITKARAGVYTVGWLVRDLAKAKTEGVSRKNQSSDATMSDWGFDVTSNWTTVTKSFNVKFSEKDLNNLTKWNGENSQLLFISMVGIRAELEPDDGVLYIDNVQVVEEK